MSVEENKILVRRYIEECLNNHNLDTIDEFIASDFVSHTASGNEGDRERHNLTRIRNWAYSPDWHITIEDVIAEGDEVVVRATGRGTHEREFVNEWGTFPPTGKQLTFPWIAIFRIADGTIVETWNRSDGALFFLQQLGLSPPT